MENNNTNPLGHEKISKLLLRFSFPAIVGMMATALYNFVDRIFIGNSPDLGPDGLAGITIAFPVMIIILAFGILFGIGGATRFSIRLGEGKPNESALSLGNAFSMIILFGLLLSIFGLVFLDPILSVFGASEAILPFARNYMSIIFYGAMFQMISIGMNHFIRADGSPKIAMITMLLGAILNIFLDPLFIFVFRWGMEGAALATVISQFVSALWVVSYFFGKKANIKLQLKNMIPRFDIILSIVSLGLPVFMLQMANSLLNMTLNRSLLEFGGDIAVSGMGIINSIAMFLLLPVIGVNQGAQPIISYNFGARKYDRVRKTALLAIGAATGIVVFGFILTRLFPTQFIAVFNRDPELLEFGTTAITAWFWGMPLIGFQVIASNFFQAIGRYKSAMFLTLTRQVILLIPAILLFPRLWGLTGLLHAAPFADMFSFILTGSWFFFAIRHLDKYQRQDTP